MTSDNAHARLSASGAHRWLRCTAAPDAESSYPDTSSPYAEEGIKAHEEAEKHLRDGTDSDNHYVQAYLDYVRPYAEQAEVTFIEHRTDFSHIVPDGFGTLDFGCYISHTQELHIIDLKYGKGVKVDADNNEQLMLYASGLYEEISFLHPIETVHMHIVQPRIPYYGTFSLSSRELLEDNNRIAAKAKETLTNPTFNPGEKQCRFCKHKTNCGALHGYTKALIIDQFDEIAEPEDLTTQNKKLLLENRNLIRDLLNSVEKEAIEEISAKSKPLYGCKLVHGRSNRVYTPDAEEVLTTILGSDAYEKKLIGVTKADTLLSKEDMREITTKPPGKPTLVSEDDPRDAIWEETINLFEELP